MPLIKYIIDSISGRNPAIKESNSDMKCVIMWSKLCKYSKIEVIENIE